MVSIWYYRIDFCQCRPKRLGRTDRREAESSVHLFPHNRYELAVFHLVFDFHSWRSTCERADRDGKTMFL